MKIIGITGGIGVGKSTVLSYLEQHYQALILQADLIAKELILPNAPLYQPYIHLFGSDIVQEDRTLNRGLIAERLFSSPDLVLTVNQLVHPMVAQEIQARISANRHLPYIVIEAALLKEGQLDTICDTIWFITAEVRIQRLMSSRGYTKEKCLGFIANQASEEEFTAYAHHTIENSGDFLSTAKQIDHIMRTL